MSPVNIKRKGNRFETFWKSYRNRKFAFAPFFFFFPLSSIRYATKRLIKAFKRFRNDKNQITLKNKILKNLELKLKDLKYMKVFNINKTKQKELCIVTI